MTEMNNHEVVSDGLERVVEAARFLGVSRSLIYKLIDAGVLPSVKIGNARRIPIRAVRDLAADHVVRHPHPDGR
ncbi:MAG: helix-turn-helix domain-containing protein [Gemmataceae bacterium]